MWLLQARYETYEMANFFDTCCETWVVDFNLRSASRSSVSTSSLVSDGGVVLLKDFMALLRPTNREGKRSVPFGEWPKYGVRVKIILFFSSCLLFRVASLDALTLRAKKLLFVRKE
jgi:hypothetical protein